MKLAVVGAHLKGLPLNGQLLELGATFVRATRTRPVYRLFALPGTTPPKPGLLRVAEPAACDELPSGLSLKVEDSRVGRGIELEVWDLPAEGFASFVAAIPPPLGIGTLELEDGEQVKGFLVESYATAGAPDITHHGGWRNYLRHQAK